MKLREYASPMIALLAALLYAVMEWLTPFQYDNLVFDAAYLEFSGGSTDFSLEAYLKYINLIRLEDNWRLANILAPASTLILDCKPLFAALCGLCVGISIWLGAWFVSGGKRPGVVAVTAVWAGMTVALPWRNNILTGDYALNYIFGMAVALIALWAILWSLRNPSLGSKALTVFMCVLLALWHEGFALPLAAGMALYIVCRRFRVSPGMWCYLLLTGGVSLAWALCSQQLTRSGVERSTPAILASPVKALAFNFMTLLLCGAVLITCVSAPLRNLFRQAVKQPPFIILGGCALAGMLLSLVVKQTGRTAFWPQMSALLAILILLRPLYCRLISRRIALWLCGMVIVALTAQALYAMKYIRIYAREYEAIMSQVDGGGTIYQDVLFPEDYPAATLGMAPRSTFIEPYTYFCIDGRYGEGKNVAVVPEALRDIAASRRDTLSLSPLVERINGRALVMEDTDELPRCGLFDAAVATSTISVPRSRTFFQIRFVGDDGKAYRYIKPFGIAAGEVVSVDI